MRIRTKLAAMLTQALRERGMGFYVEAADLHRMYAGYWQRSAGAASWFAVAHRLVQPGTDLTIVSWDRMATCVRRGFVLEFSNSTRDWEANALVG